MRVTIVTGSGSGMGAAVSRYLRDSGGDVLGIDLKDADIEADLGTSGGRALAVDAITARCGGTIDAVIACAGISPPHPGDRIVAVNYFGVTEMIVALQPLLAKGRDPRALALSSIAAILPCDLRIVDACLADDEFSAQRLAAQDASLAYRSGKLALTRWIRRTAVQPEWSGNGILLNGVAPGMVRTPLSAPVLATAEGEAKMRAAVPIAVADFAGPQALAPLLAFLSGPENRYMVGQVLFADGGSEVLMRGADAFP